MRPALRDGETRPASPISQALIPYADPNNLFRGTIDEMKTTINVFRTKNYTEDELGYPTEAYGRIPSFTNRDDEAAFWDTHDMTEFYGVELQPVEVTIGGELAERIRLRQEQEAAKS